VGIALEGTHAALRPRCCVQYLKDGSVRAMHGVPACDTSRPIAGAALGPSFAASQDARGTSLEDTARGIAAVGPATVRCSRSLQAGAATCWEAWEIRQTGSTGTIGGEPRSHVIIRQCLVQSSVSTESAASPWCTARNDAYSMVCSMTLLEPVLMSLSRQDDHEQLLHRQLIVCCSV